MDPQAKDEQWPEAADALEEYLRIIRPREDPAIAVRAVYARQRTADWSRFAEDNARMLRAVGEALEGKMQVGDGPLRCFGTPHFVVAGRDGEREEGEGAEGGDRFTGLGGQRIGEGRAKRGFDWPGRPGARRRVFQTNVMMWPSSGEQMPTSPFNALSMPAISAGLSRRIAAAKAAEVMDEARRDAGQRQDASPPSSPCLLPSPSLRVRLVVLPFLLPGAPHGTGNRPLSSIPRLRSPAPG